MIENIVLESENCKKSNRQLMCHKQFGTTRPGGNARHSLTLVMRLKLLNVIKKLQFATRNVSRLLLMKTKR